MTTAQSSGIAENSGWVERPSFDDRVYLGKEGIVVFQPTFDFGQMV